MATPEAGIRAKTAAGARADTQKIATRAAIPFRNQCNMLPLPSLLFPWQALRAAFPRLPAILPDHHSAAGVTDALPEITFVPSASVTDRRRVTRPVSS